MPGRRVKVIFKRFLIVINCVLAATFLIACLVPYLNPSIWWFMGLFGIAVPYLAIVLIFFIFFWWVVKPVWSLIPIITLIIGWKQLSVLFATHKYEAFTEKKDSTHLRILDWNIRSFEGLSNKADKKRLDRATIPEAIITQNPDVICLQEFNNSAAQNNVAPFKAKYPHYYFSKDFEREKQDYQSGSIIFSRFPIVATGKIKFPGKYGESIIYADIQTPRKIVRVFTTHLQSFKFTKIDYDGLEKIRNTEEKALPASKDILQKMKQAYTKKGEQANIVRSALDKSPYPGIICGDFNDVPNSYTYFHIRGNWNDVFLETSLGIGRTYLALAPTLRIDYILVDNNFYIQQFDLFDEDLSDHLMLVADVGIR
ncbi:MAG TPA: endonuclease/exonuclease/phosphatase family protein [Segetibacter sp.]|jgi:endonuclease/exonuclease/phosphatase family metal-dependent hydrolase